MRHRRRRPSLGAWWRARVVTRGFVRGGQGRAGARARRMLAVHSHDEHLHVLHDRLHAPLRTLGHDGVGAYELDEVGAWLEADLLAAGAPTSAGGRLALVPTMLGAACLTVLALLAWGWFSVVGRDHRPGALIAAVDDSAWAARGGQGDDGLALEALCGPRIRFARPEGCARDEELTFAVRVSNSLGAGHVSLFGIAESGDSLYYAPTPAEPAAIAIDPRDAGTWRGVGFGVRLGVNHEPGAVRVFAIFTPRSVSVAQVDAWTAILRDDRAGSDPGRDLLDVLGLHGSAMCPAAGDCAAASLDISIRPETPVAPGNGAP